MTPQKLSDGHCSEQHSPIYNRIWWVAGTLVGFGITVALATIGLANCMTSSCADIASEAKEKSIRIEQTQITLKEQASETNKRLYLIERSLNRIEGELGTKQR